MRQVFQSESDLERFCVDQGWSLGRLQGQSPRGVICSPKYDIQKWRNLRPDDRRALDGVVIRAGRSGPWTLLIGEEHVARHLRAA
jgi:hypothetical protein